MKVYLISVVICFWVFLAILAAGARKDKGCSKDIIQPERLKPGNVAGCVILAVIWPLVIIGAVVMAFMDYWRAK